MINFIGIIILLSIHTMLFIGVIKYYKHKVDLSDNDIAERDRELGKRTATIRDKNNIIKWQDAIIRDLEDENKRIKREYSKRLRKNS